jgi:ABC-type transport system involved in cytochrome c biogenesis permease subunit
MRRLLENLASLKLTVALVILLLIALATGTIVESLRGTEAGRAIYYAPWFYAIEALFGANLLAALIVRWPQNRWRIGFALTHTSMLLILVGALVTDRFKVEGQLPLWEGQEANEFLERKGDDVSHVALPFTLRLDDFQMDYYPGTRRPAMFRSQVTVRAGGVDTPAMLQMNEPLHHGGWSFFQSSYQIENGREMSILSVSKDPGQAIVFLGYTLLVVGMIVVFATRLLQKRQMAARAAAMACLALAIGVASALPATAAQVPDRGVTELLRGLPVQNDGRNMPLDTQARNAVWEVTGHRAWPGIDPVAMVLGWTVDPTGWSQQPIVKLGGAEVATAIGASGQSWAAFDALVQNQQLRQALGEAHRRQVGDAKPSGVDKKLFALEQRLGVLDDYFRGRAVHPLPGTTAEQPWAPVSFRSTSELVGVEKQIRSQPPADYPSNDAIARELTYNEKGPTRLAWWILLPAALAAGFAVARDWRWPRAVAAVGMVAGFGVMSWGLWLRWQIAGHIPASDMFESMLFLAWGVGLFGIIALALRNRLLIANAAGLSAVAMMLVDLLPIDPFIHPMPPVLSGTPWLAIHVPIIVISYSVLAMVTVLGHLVIGIEIFAPKRQELAARWSELLYYYIHVGSILLIAGILTGSIWAASSWGRYWGWDPKEVWSLVAFLAYMAILHARFDQQMASFGVAASSIAAFWTILMTYLGVNFVLAAGLHSYGFGSSKMVSVLVIVALVEAAFLAVGWMAHRRNVAARA